MGLSRLYDSPLAATVRAMNTPYRAPASRLLVIPISWPAFDLHMKGVEAVCRFVLTTVETAVTGTVGARTNPASAANSLQTVARESSGLAYCSCTGEELWRNSVKEQAQRRKAGAHDQQIRLDATAGEIADQLRFPETTRSKFEK